MSATVTPVSALLGRQHRLALRAVLGLQRAAGEDRWLRVPQIAARLGAGQDEAQELLTDLSGRGLLQREMGRHEDMFRLTRQGRDLAVTVTPSGVIDGSREYPELPRFGADESDLNEEVAS